MTVVSFSGLREARDGEAQSKGKKQREALIAAVDIGSSKISCMIGERVPLKHVAADPRLSIKLIGFGQIASRGVRNGAVINIREAEAAIRLAVDAAEKMAGRAIDKVHVNITGGRPQCVRHQAVVEIVDGVVKASDVEHAIITALKSATIGNRVVLHLSQLGFTLDGAQSKSAPLGLHGRELGIEIGVVTVEPAALQNISMAMDRAHLGVDSFVLTPLAAARSVLTDDEMQLGTAIVDIGAYVTSIGVMHEGQLVAADVIPVGAHQLTLDVAHGLSTSIAHAERMKTLYGSVLSDGHDAHEVLAAPLLGEKGKDQMQRVQRGTLNMIIRPRMEEMLEHILHRIESFGIPSMRIVFTGGGAELAGLRELAQVVTARHVRIAKPTELRGLSDITSVSAQAVCAGLLCQVLNPEKHYAMPEEAAADIERRQLTYTQRLGRWFKEAL
jgi:cell division protein FtsA